MFNPRSAFKYDMSKPEQKQQLEQNDDLVAEVGDFDRADPPEESDEEEDDSNMKEEFDELHDRLDKLQKVVTKGNSKLGDDIVSIHSKLDSILMVLQALMPGSPMIPPQSPQKSKAKKPKSGK
jgi:type I site-specific restriction-modification system R (restriction) subunit